MSKTHPDVEYAVDDFDGKEKCFFAFEEAAALALRVACSRGQSHLDVLVWSEGGAKHYAGDDGAERYKEDEDASVFERFEISVNNAGMIP